jgi:hypothetical protein
VVTQSRAVRLGDDHPAGGAARLPGVEEAGELRRGVVADHADGEAGRRSIPPTAVATRLVHLGRITDAGRERAVAVRGRPSILAESRERCGTPGERGAHEVGKGQQGSSHV